MAAILSQNVGDQYAYLRAQQSQGLLSNTMEIEWITSNSPSPFKIKLTNVSETDISSMQVLVKTDSFSISEFRVTAFDEHGKLVINNIGLPSGDRGLTAWSQLNESLALTTGARVFTPFKNVANKAPVNEWIDYIGNPYYVINYNGHNLYGNVKFYNFVLSFEK